MRTSRLFRKHSFHLCMALLALTSGRIIDEAHADTSHWYKGPWVIYEDWEHVHILVETNKGVKDDFEHRRLHFYDYGSCNEPNWGYDYESINFSGTTKDRRLWTMWAHNLTPGCRYKYKFSFRLTELSLWSEVSGAFTAGAEDVPDQGYFYALGDQRYIDSHSKDPINNVAEQVFTDHDNPAFVINTGDIVYQGGYYFPDHDNWWPYFRLKYVRDLFAAMPTFPTPGNHDVGYGHGYADVDAWNYTRYFPYTNITHDAREVYYQRTYGQFHIFSLTSYPMDKDQYCSNTNANYRPKDKGGTGQYDWLEDELKAIEHDPRQWKIVFMHAPIYSPADCYNQWDAKTYLKPLFEKYGVDIFFAGHEHYYARKTVNDIPYLILGGGGAGLEFKNTECLTEPNTKECRYFDKIAKKYHYAHFVVKGDIMYAAIHDENGDRFDYFKVDRTPKADFDVDPENATVGSIVKFTDKSTGHRYEYKWDFGDGTTHKWGPGSDASVEYTYLQEGTYTVTLTIKSAYQTDTKTCTACVTVAPQADFDAPPLEGAAPLDVSFQDKSEGPVSSWLWNFGDGNTSSEQNPVHTYDENGRYSVSLTVSNNGFSNRKAERDYIKVEPYAEFNYTMSMLCVRWKFFVCREWEYPTSFANLSQGSGLTYHWDFGDDDTSSAENPTHTYSHEGERAKLTVTDSAGQTDYMAKYIQVGSGTPAEPIEVDIMPEDDSNLIGISDRGRLWPEVIPVAILSNESFDASWLDTDTITFGLTGYEASLVKCDEKLWDVNGDGYGDMVCRFEARQTGFRIGDDKGILRGMMITDWRLMEGKDYVQIKEFQDPIHR